jgi:arylsulfatase A-like enzyme
VVGGPNFVMMVADQLRADALGAFGRPDAATPHLDALAAEGTDFDEAAVRTAEAWLRTTPSRPWLLFVPLVMPHCPFQAAEPWFSMHRREAQPLPVPPPADRQGAPGYLRALRDRHGLDRASPAIWQEVAAVYRGMVSRLDWHVGRIQAAVAAAGVADDTVVVFFSDHGEYLGDFGVIEKWPSAMHPCITQDPVIIGGGGLPSGQSCAAMVGTHRRVPHIARVRRRRRPAFSFRSQPAPPVGRPEHRAPRVCLHRGRLPHRGRGAVRAGPLPVRPQGGAAA